MATPVLNLRVDAARKARWTKAAKRKGFKDLSKFIRDAADAAADTDGAGPAVPPKPAKNVPAKARGAANTGKAKTTPAKRDKTLTRKATKRRPSAASSRTERPGSGAAKDKRASSRASASRARSGDKKGKNR